jgi:hypothetical protein
MMGGTSAPGQDIYDVIKEDEGDTSTDILSSEEEVEQ